MESQSNSAPHGQLSHLPTIFENDCPKAASGSTQSALREAVSSASGCRGPSRLRARTSRLVGFDDGWPQLSPAEISRRSQMGLGTIGMGGSRILSVPSGALHRCRQELPDPLLSLFDAPDGTTFCPARQRTNTPLQAMTLMNDPIFVSAAQRLAKDVMRGNGVTERERLERLWRACLGRDPSLMRYRFSRICFEACRSSTIRRFGETPCYEGIHLVPHGSHPIELGRSDDTRVKELVTNSFVEQISRLGFMMYRRDFIGKGIQGLGGLALASLLASEGFRGARRKLLSNKTLGLHASLTLHHAPKTAFSFHVGRSKSSRSLRPQTHPPSTQWSVPTRFDREIGSVCLCEERHCQVARVSLSISTQRAFWYLLIRLASSFASRRSSMHLRAIDANRLLQSSTWSSLHAHRCNTIGSTFARFLGSVWFRDPFQELPAFVVLRSGVEVEGGASNWSSGFLPSSYQGVAFRRDGPPF